MVNFEGFVYIQQYLIKIISNSTHRLGDNRITEITLKVDG